MTGEEAAVQMATYSYEDATRAMNRRSVREVGDDILDAAPTAEAVVDSTEQAGVAAEVE